MRRDKDSLRRSTLQLDCDDNAKPINVFHLVLMYDSILIVTISTTRNSFVLFHD